MTWSILIYNFCIHMYVLLKTIPPKSSGKIKREWGKNMYIQWIYTYMTTTTTLMMAFSLIDEEGLPVMIFIVALHSKGLR